jgi:threonine aldolase
LSRRFSAGRVSRGDGLIEIENTANLAGGGCTPVPVVEEIWAGAKERKLPTHLDGARIFNAAVALGVDVVALTRGFDTVMFCLSKGLGAPVGRCWWARRS